MKRVAGVSVFVAVALSLGSVGAHASYVARHPLKGAGAVEVQPDAPPLSVTCTGPGVTADYPGRRCVFAYSGATQTLQVSGTGPVSFKLWGAGGGGRDYVGGAGGFASGQIANSGTQTYTVIVGQGGDLVDGVSAFGGGGVRNLDGGNAGGRGGGRSGVRLGGGAEDLLTAGGGGGGGYTVGGAGGPGGAGGGAAGLAGSGNGAGGGGTQSAGGAAGVASGTASPGGKYQGGANSPSGTWSGGAGGGGYWGGGGASGLSGGHGGGGGGSGHCEAVVQNCVLTAGSGATPPATGDAAYASGVAVGGTTAAGHGRVVVTW